MNLAPALAGTLFGLASALAWSFANLAIQKATRRFGPFPTLFTAQAIGGALAVAVGLTVDGAPARPTLEVLAILAVAGVAAACAYSGLFESLERGAAGVVAPIISAWAAATVLIEVFVFDRALTGLSMLGIGCVVIGNAVLAHYESGGKHATATPRAAIVWALISALGFGVMVPATRRLEPWCGSILVVPAVWAAQWILVYPFARRRAGRTLFPASLSALYLAALPGVLEVIGFLALTIGMTQAPITILAPTSSLSTGLTVLFSLLILRERLRGPALFGAALASSGVLLLNL